MKRMNDLGLGIPPCGLAAQEAELRASATQGGGERGQEDRRRGVALIIVLGFLSIMVVMAVAFLTQARVERMVAGASLEGMRTRQLAQTSIAAGMQDYLNALMSVSPADRDYDIFLSGDAPGTISFYYSGEVMGDDRLVSGKVEDWLLDRHLAAALGGGDPSDDAQNAEWIWVREEPRARSRILGRYAYACFDMSGLLDANLLGTDYGASVPSYGDATNRNNVRKMVFEAMDKNTGGNSQLTLHDHQRVWKGFDTPAALLNLTDGHWNDGRNVGVNRWTGVDMAEPAALDTASLAAYSYSALHYEDGGGNKKIPCTSAAIQGDPDFKKIWAGATQADVQKALQDYEDIDSAPQGNPDYPSVEAVPMFNEVGVQAELVAGGATGYQLKFRLKMEFWYPFPSKDNDNTSTFTMDLPGFGGGRAATGPADIWLRFMGGLDSSTPSITLVPGAVSSVPSGSLSVAAKFNGGQPYYAANADANGDIVYTVDLTDTNGLAPPAGLFLFPRTLQIKQMKLNFGGGAVDATPPNGPPANSSMDFDLTPVGPLGGIPAGAPTPWKSKAVDDPRLNHLASSWSVEDPPTPGLINQAASNAISTATTSMGITPGRYFYCRNAPIERPAELGYLPTGKPWESLDIFNADGIRLMNRVVCDYDEYTNLAYRTVFFTNGTINPYTRNTNVLNAAFYGLDMREVPNLPGTLQETNRFVDNLDELVDSIMLSKTNNGYAGWGKAFAAGGNLPVALNKNVGIALMNRTWGLFGESDRLFVIAVIAQSIKEGADAAGVGNWNPDEDMVTGERRAVALCWMDGSADVGGLTLSREMDVIMFQYLNE